MTSIIIALIIIVAIVAITYYLLKKLAVLLVNAILGLALLVIFNFFHVMQWIQRPDLGYDFATLLICGIGGVTGVMIRVLFNILGITI